MNWTGFFSFFFILHTRSKMRFQSLAFLAGISAVAADSTVTLFIPGLDAHSLEGKILGSVGCLFTDLICILTC